MFFRLFCGLMAVVITCCSAADTTVSANGVTNSATNATETATVTETTTTVTTTEDPIKVRNAATASAHAFLQGILPSIAGVSTSANDAATPLTKNPGYLCRLESRIQYNDPSIISPSKAYMTLTFCIGILMDANTVLTAGGCVGTWARKTFLALNNGKFNIVCGDLYTGSKAKFTTRQTVQFDINNDRISRPSSYDKGQAEDSNTGYPKPYNQDMVKLHLSKPFTENSEIVTSSATFTKYTVTAGTTHNIYGLRYDGVETSLSQTSWEFNVNVTFISYSVLFESSCQSGDSGLVCYNLAKHPGPFVYHALGAPVLHDDASIGGMLSAFSFETGSITGGSTTTQGPVALYIYGISDLYNFCGRPIKTFISQTLQSWTRTMFGK